MEKELNYFVVTNRVIVELVETSVTFTYDTTNVTVTNYNLYIRNHIFEV